MHCISIYPHQQYQFGYNKQVFFKVRPKNTNILLWYKTKWDTTPFQRTLDKYGTFDSTVTGTTVITKLRKQRQVFVDFYQVCILQKQYLNFMTPSGLFVSIQLWKKFQFVANRHFKIVFFSEWCKQIDSY